MADKKISALTAATTPLAGTEVLPIVQSGTTVKVSVNNLTAGKAVSTGIVTSTATTGSQAIYTGWSPTGGAHPANGSIDFGTSATNKGIVSYDSTGAFPGALYIENTYNDGSASTRIRLRGVDRIIAKGNGDVSIASGNVVMDTAGKGIDFSANANAPGMTSELLDWYETGTWTPTVEGSTTAGTQTYAWQYGKYTRVGNQVTVNGSVRVASTSGMAGNVRIQGLPFTGIAGQLNAGGASVSEWGNLVSNSYVMMAGNIPASAAYIDLTGATAATTSVGAVVVASIAGGSYLNFTAVYFV